MNIRQTLQNSVRSLFVNKGRCLQAILGMVIGIAGFVFAWTANNISLMDLQIQQDEYAPTLMQTWTYVSVDLPMKVMPSDMEQLAQDNPEIISGISPYVEFDLPGGVRYGEAECAGASGKAGAVKILAVQAVGHELPEL